MHNLDNLGHFLEMVLGTCPDEGVTTLVAFEVEGPPSFTKAFRVSELEQLKSQAERLLKRPHVDIYYRPTVMREVPEIGKRGSEKDTWGGGSLYVDLDYYKRSLQLEFVLQTLEEFSLPPSIVVHSGGGLQESKLRSTGGDFGLGSQDPATEATDRSLGRRQRRKHKVRPLIDHPA